MTNLDLARIIKTEMRRQDTIISAAMRRRNVLAGAATRLRLGVAQSVVLTELEVAGEAVDLTVTEDTRCDATGA